MKSKFASKISKLGDELVVSLPKEITEPLGLQEGDEVFVSIELTPASLAIMDPAFVKQINDFIELYRPALDALSR